MLLLWLCYITRRPDNRGMLIDPLRSTRGRISFSDDHLLMGCTKYWNVHLIKTVGGCGRSMSRLGNGLQEEEEKQKPISQGLFEDPASRVREMLVRRHQYQAGNSSLHKQCTERNGSTKWLLPSEPWKLRIWADEVIKCSSRSSYHRWQRFGTSSLQIPLAVYSWRVQIQPACCVVVPQSCGASA